MGLWKAKVIYHFITYVPWLDEVIWTLSATLIAVNVRSTTTVVITLDLITRWTQTLLLSRLDTETKSTPVHSFKLPCSSDNVSIYNLIVIVVQQIKTIAVCLDFRAKTPDKSVSFESHHSEFKIWILINRITHVSAGDEPLRHPDRLLNCHNNLRKQRNPKQTQSRVVKGFVCGSFWQRLHVQLSPLHHQRMYMAAVCCFFSLLFGCFTITGYRNVKSWYCTKHVAV